MGVGEQKSSGTGTLSWVPGCPGIFALYVMIFGPRIRIVRSILSSLSYSQHEISTLSFNFTVLGAVHSFV